MCAILGLYVYARIFLPYFRQKKLLLKHLFLLVVTVSLSSSPNSRNARALILFLNTHTITRLT